MPSENVPAPQGEQVLLLNPYPALQLVQTPSVTWHVRHPLSEQLAHGFIPAENVSVGQAGQVSPEGADPAAHAEHTPVEETQLVQLEQGSQVVALLVVEKVLGSHDWQAEVVVLKNCPGEHC